MDNFLEHWLWSTVQGRVVVAVAGVLIIGVLLRLSHQLVGRRVEEADRRHQMRKLATFVAYLVAIGFLLVTFRGDLGNVTVAIGITGAAVAFALQEVILSVAGWLTNVLGHFYKTGDRIKLAGILGDVIDMGVLRTTLMECGEWVGEDLYNGRIVRVANSFVFKEPVFNYSADFPFVWDEIAVPVKFGCEQTLARQILRKVANEEVGDYTAFAQRAWKEMVRKYLIEDARVEPVVTMVANDNWRANLKSCAEVLQLDQEAQL